jgi:hypothetical protein
VVRRALALAIPLALATAGCLPPGVGTLLEKGVAEVRGGRGEAREINPLPAAPALDRFRTFRVLPVERSPDAGPIPRDLPKIIETQLRTVLRDAQLPTGRGTPSLLIRTRLTTHWQADGALQAMSAHSEVLARVEFLEDGVEGPAMGVYYVRGVSTALARRTNEHLGRGLAEGVVELIMSRRSPPRSTAALPARATEER